MNKIKKMLEQEFIHGYTLFDRLFMLAALIVQIGIFIVVPDSWISIVCGVTGVISSILCAQGKISFYFIGFIQTGTYLVLSWQNKFYGEVLENLFYLVSMIWGIFVWKKNSQVDENDSANVQAKKLSLRMWLLLGITTIIGTGVLGYLLDSIGSSQAYLDAATNVMAVYAQLLMVRRYREQWAWWLGVDICALILWINAGNWSMVVMYIVWILNCCFGWYHWTKLEKASIKNVELTNSIKE